MKADTLIPRLFLMRKVQAKYWSSQLRGVVRKADVREIVPLMTGQAAAELCNNIVGVACQPGKISISLPNQTTIEIRAESEDAIHRGALSQIMGSVVQYDHLSKEVKKSVPRETLEKSVQTFIERRCVFRKRRIKTAS